MPASLTSYYIHSNPDIQNAMHLIQLTPIELISFVLEEVQKAVARAMPNQDLGESETRSAAAVRQARYRERVKARALAAKQGEAAASDSRSAPAAPPVTSVTGHVISHVTGVTDHVTTVTNHVISVTCHGAQDPAPLPPSSPLPPSPQTPLSPAPLHPPAPVEGAHAYVREEGEVGGEGFSSQNPEPNPETQPEGIADVTPLAEPTMVQNFASGEMVGDVPARRRMAVAEPGRPSATSAQNEPANLRHVLHAPAPRRLPFPETTGPAPHAEMANASAGQNVSIANHEKNFR